MSDRHDGLRVRAARLARAAQDLKRASRAEAPFRLAFLTDRARIPDPEPILRVLPAGAAVIYRDYDDPRRGARAARYRQICLGRGVLFLVAGDAALARALGADGIHLPARMLAPANAAADMMATAACHDEAELMRAAALGAAAAFLAPAFATASHPGESALGPARFKALAARAALPVLALGGVDAGNAALICGKNVAGFGAIGAFAAPRAAAG